MKTNRWIPILTLLLCCLSCADHKKENDEVALKIQIDDYITQSMESNSIPGLALAVIREDEVVYQNYFGKASLETESPVDKNTLFRIFSTTKLITATGVFQLVQEGKLALEDTISKHLANVPEQWEQVKIKNLLSHSSGIPDMIRYDNSLSDSELLEKLASVEMDFDTGSQFRYNQTNFWLLAQIVEKVTGMPFDEFILKHQFNTPDDEVLFSSNSQETIPNRATRYFYNGKTKSFDTDTNNNGVRGHSGNGINISLDAFIAWNQRLDDDILLNAATKQQMWEPFQYTNGKNDFLLGWGTYKVNEIPSYGFTGGNLSAFRKFVTDDTTIILVSNGYKNPAYDIIVNDIARMVIPQLKSKDPTLEKEVMDLVEQGNFDTAMGTFQKLKRENPDTSFGNLNGNINSMGNALVRVGNMEEAYQVFSFNAQMNPDWWIAVAGLAEVQEMKGDIVDAVENYKKAIALNPKNEYGYNPILQNKITELQNK